MVRRKSNKVLIRLLIIIFIYNALIIKIGTTIAVPSTQKVSFVDTGQSDSVMVQRCSSYMLIDNLETALNYGHSHQDTLDKLYTAKGLIYRAGLQKSIIATSNGTKIIIDKKVSPIKINAPPIIGDNSKIL